MRDNLETKAKKQGEKIKKSMLLVVLSMLFTIFAKNRPRPNKTSELALFWACTVFAYNY
jgi:hypothetical protein